MTVQSVFPISVIGCQFKLLLATNNYFYYIYSTCIILICADFFSLQYPIQEDEQKDSLPFAASQCCEFLPLDLSHPLDGAKSSHFFLLSVSALLHTVFILISLFKPNDINSQFSLFVMLRPN